MTRSIDIVDVGPIQQLEIPIPAEGGVVVLRGRNGAGKTTGLNAVGALLDGEGSFTPRDGQERGSVAGLGCEIVVKKRTSHAGTAEVERIRGEDPALLVDPGIASQPAADRARLKALCRLARVEPSRELFAPLEEIAGVPLPITLADDVPESAAKTKRSIEAKAREIEAEMQKAAGRYDQLTADLERVDLSAPSDQAVLAREAEEAVRALASAEGVAEGSRKALQAAQMAREALATARAAYTGLTTEGANAKLNEADLAERAARETLAKAQAARSAASAELTRAREFERAVEGWEASIKGAEGLAEADQEALAALRARVVAANAARDLGVEVRKGLARKAEAEQAEAARRELSGRAERMREAAIGCDRLVSDAIAKVAPRGLVVDGDRLMVEHARGLIPFEQLSHGERWTIALDVAIDAVGPNGLLSIAQEAWEGLDAERREQIAEHARSRGAVIVTAEATAEDLHAAVLQ